MSAFYDEATRRRILEIARKNLVGYTPREQRVAEALKLARKNIAPLIEREASAWRGERIRRQTADARATLERTAHIGPPPVSAKIHNITDSARVAPEARPKAEPPPRERRPDTAETDWSAWNNWCDSRIDAKREFDREVLVEVVADLKGLIEDQGDALKVQAEIIRSLEIKLSELWAANDLRSADKNVKLAEDRIAIGELRPRDNGPIDLPNPISHRVS